MPVPARCSCALWATLRGSRVYDSPVIGSRTSQIIDSVGNSWNGSMSAVAGSGTSSMSDSLISWKPRIDEPSKPAPSVSRPSPSSRAATAKCCQVPGRSVNLRSTRWTSWSRANATTSSGLGAALSRTGMASGGPSGVGSGSLIRDTGPPLRRSGVRRRTYPGAPAVALARRAKPLGPPVQSDLEPLVLEVELALDPVHDVVRDRAVVAQPNDRAPLRVEHLADDPLVGGRAVLVAVVLDLAGARLEPPAAVVVGPRHAVDRVLARPLLGAELLDPRERRLRRDEPRAELLVRLGAVVVDPERADERRQREALDDERHEDHREREEDDEVALRRRCGQGERGCERHGAAHARPRHDHPDPPARAALALALAAVERADDVRHRPAPDEAGGDDDGRHRGRRAEHEAGRLAAERVEDGGQLQADEDEQDRVEQECQRRPEREQLLADVRRRDPGRPPPERDAGGDSGDDARRADRVGRHVRGVAAEE